MKRLLGMVIGLWLAFAGVAQAVEVEGVTLPPEMTVQGQALRLNGYGIREKFFFDIYVGALYTVRTVASTEAALALPGPKLIRMDFLYHEVGREKIIEAFAEGFEKNAPALVGGAEEKAFFDWFVHDFVRGDEVELELGGEGTVSARQNGEHLGSLRSPQLARGVLLIYLGAKPADSDLKRGMLGGH